MKQELFLVHISCVLIFFLEIDTLLKYYKSNNYTKTKKYALFLTEQFPDHDLAWKILSIVFEKTGKISESLTVIKKIVNKYIKENLNINIDTMMQDQEHYNVEAHKLIAHHFIPEVLHASK